VILRVFMPHGAHIRFDGVEKVQAAGTSYINFFYEAKDANGKATDNKAHAVFNTSVIAGYSLENTE
jgi:hypothetical protein